MFGDGMMMDLGSDLGTAFDLNNSLAPLFGDHIQCLLSLTPADGRLGNEVRCCLLVGAVRMYAGQICVVSTFKVRSL